MNNTYFLHNNDDLEGITKEDRNALHMIGCLSMLAFPMLLFLVLILSLLLCSCESTKYIPVETVRTEYVNKTDTLIKTNVVFNEKETVIREADSAVIAKLGLQLKANERAVLVLKTELERQMSSQSEHRTDTILKSDTVRVPYPVEKKLTKWQQVRLDTWGITFCICLVSIIVIIVCWVIRLRK
jgi:hypothetical protein